MTSEIVRTTEGLTWLMKELRPNPNQLGAIRLVAYDRLISYDLLLVAENLQPLLKPRRTHKVTVTKIFHDRRDRKQIWERSLNLMRSGYDWEKPVEKAERIFFRVGYYIAMLPVIENQRLSQLVEQIDWFEVIDRCARKELGSLHQLLPT